MEISPDSMNMLIARIEALEKAVFKQPTRASAAEGTIPRGKYRGRDHAEIVKLDPQHVMWMNEQGFAKSFGYTDAHIEDARCAIQLQEEPD